MRNLFMFILLMASFMVCSAHQGANFTSEEPTSVNIAKTSGESFDILVPGEASSQVFSKLLENVGAVTLSSNTIMDDNPADGRYYAYWVLSGRTESGQGYVVALPLRKDRQDDHTSYSLDMRDFSGPQAKVVHTCTESGDCNPGICKLGRTWYGKVTSCYCTSNSQNDVCEHSVSSEGDGITLDSVSKVISIISVFI